MPKDASIIILNRHGVDYMTPKAAADYIGRSAAWVRRNLRGFRHFCPGCGRMYYRRQDLEPYRTGKGGGNEGPEKT